MSPAHFTGSPVKRESQARASSFENTTLSVGAGTSVLASRLRIVNLVSESDLPRQALPPEKGKIRNHNAGLPPFRTLQVLDGGAYGWVEEIETHPCQNQQEVEAYYFRAGMLVCQIYALEGSDCHHENLIAAGEHPVVIDHETLLQPRIRYFGSQGEEGPLSLAGEFFGQDSVFRTALLPRREIRPTGESYDISGLGGTEAHLTHRRKRTWENVNTDAMRLREEEILVQPAHNVVILDGEKVLAAA